LAQVVVVVLPVMAQTAQQELLLLHLVLQLQAVEVGAATMLLTKTLIQLADQAAAARDTELLADPGEGHLVLDPVPQEFRDKDILAVMVIMDSLTAVVAAAVLANLVIAAVEITQQAQSIQVQDRGPLQTI
jgi:hypothetical protein